MCLFPYLECECHLYHPSVPSAQKSTWHIVSAHNYSLNEWMRSGWGRWFDRGFLNAEPEFRVIRMILDCRQVRIGHQKPFLRWLLSGQGSWGKARVQQGSTAFKEAQNKGEAGGVSSYSPLGVAKRCLREINIFTKQAEIKREVSIFKPMLIKQNERQSTHLYPKILESRLCLYLLLYVLSRWFQCWILGKHLVLFAALPR